MSDKSRHWMGGSRKNDKYLKDSPIVRQKKFFEQQRQNPQNSLPQFSEQEPNTKIARLEPKPTSNTTFPQSIDILAMSGLLEKMFHTNQEHEIRPYSAPCSSSSGDNSSGEQNVRFYDQGKDKTAETKTSLSFN